MSLARNNGKFVMILPDFKIETVRLVLQWSIEGYIHLIEQSTVDKVMLLLHSLDTCAKLSVERKIANINVSHEHEKTTDDNNVMAVNEHAKSEGSGKTNSYMFDGEGSKNVNLHSSSKKSSMLHMQSYKEDDELCHDKGIQLDSENDNSELKSKMLANCNDHVLSAIAENNVMEVDLTLEDNDNSDNALIEISGDSQVAPLNSEKSSANSTPSQNSTKLGKIIDLGLDDDNFAHAPSVTAESGMEVDLTQEDDDKEKEVDHDDGNNDDDGHGDDSDDDYGAKRLDGLSRESSSTSSPSPKSTKVGIPKELHVDNDDDHDDNDDDDDDFEVNELEDNNSEKTAEINSITSTTAMLGESPDQEKEMGLPASESAANKHCKNIKTKQKVASLPNNQTNFRDSIRCQLCDEMHQTYDQYAKHLSVKHYEKQLMDLFKHDESACPICDKSMVGPKRDKIIHLGIAHKQVLFVACRPVKAQLEDLLAFGQSPKPKYGVWKLCKWHFAKMKNKWSCCKNFTCSPQDLRFHIASSHYENELIAIHGAMGKPCRLCCADQQYVKHCKKDIVLHMLSSHSGILYKLMEKREGLMLQECFKK